MFAIITTEKFKLLFTDSIWRQFIIFCLVGILNTAIDFSVYLFLTRNFNFFSNFFIIANIISFSCAVISSYYLNSRWIFKFNTDNNTKRFSMFLVVSLFGLLINSFILYLFVNYVELTDITAKIIATIIVLFWNFFINKYWTFKKSIVK